MNRTRDGKGPEAPTPVEGALSRRRFGQLAVLGLAGGAVLPAELLKVGAPSGSPDVVPQQQARPVPPAAPGEIEEALRRIFAEYGDRLSESQKQQMRGIVARHVQMLDTVRAVSVSNPDAPATVLKLVTDK
jgi:hypothetical protein